MGLSHSGLKISSSRSGRSQGPHLIPFHHPKWETPTLVSAARRDVSWTTSERESDASGNHYTDGRWHGSLVFMRFLRSPNRETYHKWTLRLFPDAWSEWRSCFISTGSVHLVRRKWSCILIIRTTMTGGKIFFQQIFRSYIIFSNCQNVFVAGWNGFAGRIWPAGRSLRTPNLENFHEVITEPTFFWSKHIRNCT